MDPTANVPPSIVTEAASMSTLALMSVFEFNMFVTALDVNVVAVLLIVTLDDVVSSPPAISTDAASMFPLDVMFSSPFSMTVLVDVIVVNALSISTLALISVFEFKMFVAAFDVNEVAVELTITLALDSTVVPVRCTFDSACIRESTELFETNTALDVMCKLAGTELPP